MSDSPGTPDSADYLTEAEFYEINALIWRRWGSGRDQHLLADCLIEALGLVTTLALRDDHPDSRRAATYAARWMRDRAERGSR